MATKDKDVGDDSQVFPCMFAHTAVLFTRIGIIRGNEHWSWAGLYNQFNFGYIDFVVPVEHLKCYKFVNGKFIGRGGS